MSTKKKAKVVAIGDGRMVHLGKRINASVKARRLATPCILAFPKIGDARMSASEAVIADRIEVLQGLFDVDDSRCESIARGHTYLAVDLSYDERGFLANYAFRDQATVILEVSVEISAAFQPE